MPFLLALPLLLILVAFALSNRQVVALGLWPTDYVLAAPLSVAILAAMGAAFLLGAVIVWGGSLGQRRRARRAETRVRVLEAELQAMRTTRPMPAGPALPAPLDA